MGLTRKSVGLDLISDKNDRLNIKTNQRVISLAGNPNAGKSSLFNLITGLNQHTGNWSGKTVGYAAGKCVYNKNEYIFVDLPGCYSLKTHSDEERVARDFICSEKSDLTVVVCDATSLERSLNLVLQIRELTENMLICLNLMDEAKKRNIKIDSKRLSDLIGVPVVCTIAHKKNSYKLILEAIENLINKKSDMISYEPLFRYPDYIENLIECLSPSFDGTPLQNRANALQHIEKTDLFIINKNKDEVSDDIAITISNKAAEITSMVVNKEKDSVFIRDLRIDKVLTHKVFGFVFMGLLLLLVFWITITGANYPSDILNTFLESFEDPIYRFLTFIKLPKTVCDALVYGVYHILSWIVSVMLPPMAIFFPLFTLLEDIGYLPRIAFNMDYCFKKCSACGKQALTMCMGAGCNAAGVVGCRIIDSKREQLIAILTNSFIPCNGRFPAIIAIITMFFIGTKNELTDSFLAALYLVLFIILACTVSLLMSKLLSKTVLKGIPSSFSLELPPFRRPRIFRIIVRSLLDRTLFVLYRAVIIAAPAGLLIWILANVKINNISIVIHISDFLDPVGQIMGLDGVILTAFILGFPANEIVVPLILMIYMSNGILTDISDINEISNILVLNGWNYVTAVNTIIFTLFHWPCSTTCLTVYAETKSWKWTLLSLLLPTACGMAICMFINFLF